MKEFTVVYKLKDKTKKKAVYEANTKTEAKFLAKRDGLKVISVNKDVRFKSIEKFLIKNHFSSRQLDIKSKISFFRELTFMLDAEINILKAIDSMKKNAINKKYRGFLKELHNSISQGNSLSAMMKKEFGFESEVKIQVESGEKSGNLSESLKLILLRLESSSKTKNKVTKQLSYPAMVMVLMVVVVNFIITNVVPGFADVLLSNGGELPKITLNLISLSNFLQKYSLTIFFIFLILVAMFIILKRRKDTGYYIDKFILKIPMIGDVILKSSLSKYFYIVYNMLLGDIKLIGATEMAARTISNKYLMKNLLKFPEEMKKNGVNYDILAKEFAPTYDYSELISTGITTGNIEIIFKKISENLDEETESKLKTLTSLIEPTLSIVMGALVGFLVMALFMPMFSIMDTF